MKRLQTLILFFMIAGFLTPAVNAFHTREVTDSLQAELPNCKTVEDSIRVLYDILDFNDVPSLELKTGNMLLDVAKRTNNQEIMRDMIPQLAVMLKNDSTGLMNLLPETDLIEDKDHRKAIRLFINVVKATVQANYIPQDKLREAILKYAEEDMTPKDDIYQDIEDLYLMVIFLGNATKGNLYLEYLERLDKLISSLPPDLYYLRSLYYTTAANCNTRNNNYERAIECDRELLKMIDALEMQFHKNGRIYRNYDRNRYICYRRMLSNYKGLTKDEIKELYAKCARLASTNATVAIDFNNSYAPTIYRNMAEGEYQAVIPLIEKSLKFVPDNYRRLQLLGMLITAADSVGNKTVALDAYKEYTKLLREQVQEHSAEASRELQIRYDVDTLRGEKEKAVIEKKDLEVKTSQRIIIVALIALLVLVVFLMVLYRSNFSLRNRVKDQLEENRKLNNLIEGMLDESENIAGSTDPRDVKKK